MNFGKVVGTACASFAITNIDDIFVLVTFFAEATTNVNLTSLQITVGQYVGFTIITIISMIGFGASLLFPSEPIGFLGLLPLLLGVWWLFGLLFPVQEAEPEAPTDLLTGEPPTTADDANVDANAETKPPAWRRRVKSIGKVSSITVMNGADNIGTYVPLFSQAKGAEIAVYVVIYYILLGVWCAAAFLIMRQKHILRLAQKNAAMVVPFLYLGLGIFILVKSGCYPWTIERIDDSEKQPRAHLGTVIMAVVTAALLLACIAAMLWLKLHKWLPARRQARAADAGSEPAALELGAAAPQDPESSELTGPAEAPGDGPEVVPVVEVVSYPPVVGSHPSSAVRGWRLPPWPKRNEPYDFKHFVIISRIHRLTAEEAAGLQTAAPPTKRRKQSDPPPPAAGVHSFHPEDELIRRFATHTLDYTFTHTQPREADAFGLNMGGRMALIPATRLPELAAALAEAYPQPS